VLKQAGKTLKMTDTEDVSVSVSGLKESVIYYPLEIQPFKVLQRY
jgi:hypothetical protein